MLNIRNLLALLALGLLLASSAESQELMLRKFITNYQTGLSSLDAVTRAIVNKFCTEVGRRRFYHYTLNTFGLDRTRYENISKFLAEFGDDLELNRIDDADAIILLHAYQRGLNNLAFIRSDEIALEEMKKLPGVQCFKFVQVLGAAVFETDSWREYANSRSLFDGELKQAGAQEQVRQFLHSWAHYQICRALVLNDTKKLAHKFYRRIEDNIRLRPELPRQRDEAEIERVFGIRIQPGQLGL